jgi:radical SAM/Cys-rich protein
VDPFSEALARHGLTLLRGTTRTLQVNVGLLCNQACRHCHLEAGPGRREVMDSSTMREVVAFAERGGFQAIDITGGAPELVPGIEVLVAALAPLTDRCLFRCNLTALADRERTDLIDLWRSLRVALVASLPACNEAQTDAQRGRGTWERSLRGLRLLNEAGYGREGTGLTLDLVSNPAGAFLPASQRETEARFRRDLSRRWGIAFTSLLTFANVPLGRFRGWLEQSGNLEPYVRTLADRFNPCAVPELMCRSQVSVGWDGCLYDCDFHLAAGLPLGGRRTHVSEWEAVPAAGMAITTADHCYACTAGSGFT